MHLFWLNLCLPTLYLLHLTLEVQQQGPMTVTLILAIVMGAAKQIEGRDPLIDGFGMTTIVALAPILTVLLLGFLYGRKEKETDG